MYTGYNRLVKNRLQCVGPSLICVACLFGIFSVALLSGCSQNNTLIESSSSPNAQYTLPPGALHRATASFTKMLNTGDQVSGSAEIQVILLPGEEEQAYEDYGDSTGWQFQIVNPNGQTIDSWSGDYIGKNQYNFSFIAADQGLYQILISDASMHSMNLALDIQPTDWKYTKS
jgi:hypothetical protein